MVDFIRLQVIDQVSQVARATDIAVMEQEPLAILMMWIAINVVNPPCIEGTGSPDQPMHLVAFREQKLRQIGAVLTRNACDQCFFHTFIQNSLSCLFFFTLNLTSFQDNRDLPAIAQKL
jgi:hypothetical protein